jgi:hypothetical protein
LLAGNHCRTSPSTSLFVLDGVNRLIRLSRPGLRMRARCRAHRWSRVSSSQ